MAVSQTQRFCQTCRKPTLHVRHYTGAAVGCLVAIVLGLLLSVFLTPLALLLCIGLWFLGALLQTLTVPYRCQQCGKGRMTFVQGFVSIVVLALAGMIGIGLLALRNRPVSPQPAPVAVEIKAPSAPRPIEINAPKLATKTIITAQIPPAQPVPPAVAQPAVKQAEPQPAAKQADWQPTLGTVCWTKSTAKVAALLSHPRHADEYNTAVADLKQGGEGATSSMKLMVDRGDLWLVPGGTRVRVVNLANLNRKFYMVEVLEGDLKSQRGWTTAKQLEPSPLKVELASKPLPTEDLATSKRSAELDAIEKERTGANRAITLLNLGRSFEKSQKPSLALKSYRELVAKYPDSPEAKTAQARIKALTKTP
jgi:hypothetical protein